MYYMMRSRSVGTPFNDSLSEEQKQIKEKSSEVRRNIFMEGIAVSAVGMFVAQPFKSC
jgi:hypothetical protein